MKKDDTYKDKGLRVAVQHKNDTAGKMTLSEDFTDRLMQRIEQQPDISNPDELTDRIMDSLPDLPTERPKPARPSHRQ